MSLPPILGWRIYYGDGRTVDSSQATWGSAPDGDVQVVIVFYDEWVRGAPCRDILQGVDYYWLDPHGHASCGNIPPPNTPVKEGRWVSDETWDRIFTSAHRDIRPPNSQEEN